MGPRSCTCLPLLAALMAPPGCFSARETGPESLRGLREAAAVRIQPRGEDPFRALVEPGGVGAATIRYELLAHPPGSWVVAFGGWPLVYSAGREWRWETTGERGEVPLEKVASLKVERYNWLLTILSLPLTLPVGAIDFLVHHLRFGFEDVDTSFDDFSGPAR